MTRTKAAGTRSVDDLLDLVKRRSVCGCGQKMDVTRPGENSVFSAGILDQGFLMDIGKLVDSFLVQLGLS